MLDDNIKNAIDSLCPFFFLSVLEYKVTQKNAVYEISENYRITTWHTAKKVQQNWKINRTKVRNAHSNVNIFSQHFQAHIRPRTNNRARNFNIGSIFPVLLSWWSTAFKTDLQACTQNQFRQRGQISRARALEIPPEVRHAAKILEEKFSDILWGRRKRCVQLKKIGCHQVRGFSHFPATPNDVVFLLYVLFHFAKFTANSQKRQMRFQYKTIFFVLSTRPPLRRRSGSTSVQ